MCKATVRNCARLGRLSLCKGEGEGEGYDLLRQMTPPPSLGYSESFREQLGAAGSPSLPVGEAAARTT
jgi:hypothetical protein